VDQSAEQVSIAPGECSIGLWTQGGGDANLAEDATAFTGRSAVYWSAWRPSGQSGTKIRSTSLGVRTTMAAIKPFTEAGALRE